MPLLDYTTKVPVSRTIAQIQAKLVELYEVMAGKGFLLGPGKREE